MNERTTPTIQKQTNTLGCQRIMLHFTLSINQMHKVTSSDYKSDCFSFASAVTTLRQNHQQALPAAREMKPDWLRRSLQVLVFNTPTSVTSRWQVVSSLLPHTCSDITGCGAFSIREVLLQWVSTAVLLPSNISKVNKYRKTISYISVSFIYDWP